MYDRERTDNTPKVCAEMQQSIEVLKWTQGALKLLPNLPKGKLREELESEISSLLDGAETPRGRLSRQCETVLESVRTCEQTLVSLDKLKRLCPNDIRELRESFAEFDVLLRTFKGQLSNFSKKF